MTFQALKAVCAAAECGFIFAATRRLATVPNYNSPSAVLCTKAAATSARTVHNATEGTAGEDTDHDRPKHKSSLLQQPPVTIA